MLLSCSPVILKLSVGKKKRKLCKNLYMRHFCLFQVVLLFWQYMKIHCMALEPCCFLPVIRVSLGARNAGNKQSNHLRKFCPSFFQRLYFHKTDKDVQSLFSCIVYFWAFPWLTKDHSPKWPIYFSDRRLPHHIIFGCHHYSKTKQLGNQNRQVSLFIVIRIGSQLCKG